MAGQHNLLITVPANAKCEENRIQAMRITP